MLQHVSKGKSMENEELTECEEVNENMEEIKNSSEKEKRGAMTNVQTIKQNYISTRIENRLKSGMDQRLVLKLS